MPQYNFEVTENVFQMKNGTHPCQKIVNVAKME